MSILLKPEEVAAELRISRSKVYQLLSTGTLASVRVSGRSRRVPREAVEDYVRALITEQAESTGRWGR